MKEKSAEIVSPEKEIRDQIRKDYKNSYANIIFTLTNTLMEKDEALHTAHIEGRKHQMKLDAEIARTRFSDHTEGEKIAKAIENEEIA